MYRDHREYNKHKQEVSQALQSQQFNPMYQDPVTHYKNPVHEKVL